MNLGPEGKATIPTDPREWEALGAAYNEFYVNRGTSKEAGIVGHEVSGTAGPGQGADFAYPGGHQHEIGFTASWEGVSSITVKRKTQQAQRYLAQGAKSVSIAIYNYSHGLVIRWSVK